MIVCSCNVLSDHDVRGCLDPGPDCPRTPAQVYRCLGCSPQCGRCARTIRAILDEAGARPSACGACPAACVSRDADDFAAFGEAGAPDALALAD